MSLSSPNRRAGAVAALVTNAFLGHPPAVLAGVSFGMLVVAGDGRRLQLPGPLR